MTGYAQEMRTELSRRAGWDKLASARSRTTSRTSRLRDVAASPLLVLFGFLLSLVPRQIVNDSYDNTNLLLSLIPRQYASNPYKSEKTKTFRSIVHAPTSQEIYEIFRNLVHAPMNQEILYEIFRNLVAKMNPVVKTLT